MSFLIEMSGAVDRLQNDGVVAFPTETVYGLGARVGSSSAVRHIYAIKGRPSFNPLIVHCFDSQQALEYVCLKNKSQQDCFNTLADLFWPGPLALVLPKTEKVSSEISAGLDSVAVRVPKHPIAQQLIRAVGEGIAAPSANTSNYLSPTAADHVLKDFSHIDLPVLQSGESEIGLESTVLSLLGKKPTILRSGAITKEMIEEALGSKVMNIEGEASGPSRSPGMSKKHYSPRTPFFIYPARFSLSMYSSESVAVVACCAADVPKELLGASNVVVLSQKNSLEEAAQRFYSTLHELDKGTVKTIFFIPCSPEGLGAAIMERATKAASF